MTRLNSTALLLSAALFAIVAFPSERIRGIPAAAFVYPLLGTRMSGKFGNRTHPVHRVVRHHSGMDLAAPRGALIRVIREGRVVFADRYAGYGNLIVVRHDNTLSSHYGHCDTIRVRAGQWVRSGAIIGTVGSTGLSTGPHLHFEIRRDGKPQNPEAYLPGLTTNTVD